MQSPLIAATVGIGSLAMRLKTVCPSARYCSTCSRDIFLISKRSAPALNERGLGEAKITPAGFSRSIASSACARSARSCGEQVLTGLPGTSSQTVTTFCSSVMVRTTDSITLPPLQEHRRPLPAPDAQRRHAQLHVPTLHLVQQREDDAGPRRADRMS